MLAAVSTPTDLSFVRSTAEMWVPERTEDYTTDCARGRLYAEELLTYIQFTEDPLVYSAVMRAMIADGVYAAVETGFCSRIGIYMIGV